jgi:hypothetical protein
VGAVPFIGGRFEGDDDLLGGAAGVVVEGDAFDLVVVVAEVAVVVDDVLVERVDGAAEQPPFGGVAVDAVRVVGDLAERRCGDGAVGAGGPGTGSPGRRWWRSSRLGSSRSGAGRWRRRAGCQPA